MKKPEFFKRKNRKKLYASIIAIVLAFMMILGIIAPFVYGAELKTEENGVTINAKIGFDNVYKVTSQETPLKIFLENSGNDIKGEVQIQLNIQSNEMERVYNTYAKPVELPHNSSKLIEFEVNIPLIQSNFVIDLVDENGKKIASKNFKATPISPEGTFIGVLSDTKDNLAYLSNLKIKSNLYLSNPNNYNNSPWNNPQEVDAVPEKIVFLNQETFPSKESTINNFDVLIINDFDTSKLSDKQKEQLLKWVKVGGTLVLGTGTNFSKIFKGLNSEFLPVVGYGTQTLTSFAIFNKDTKSSNYLTNKNMTIEDIDIKNATESLKENNITVLTKAKNENGTIMVCHFDLGFEPFSSWAGASDFLSVNILRSFNNMYGNGMNDYYSGYSPLPSFNTGNIVVAFIIIVVYITFIGPVLYVYLKFKDKRENAWIIIPITAIIVTFVIYGLSFKTAYRNPIVQTSTLITPIEDSSMASAKVDMNILTAQNGTVEIKFDDNIPITRNNSYGAYNSMYYAGPQSAQNPKKSEPKSKLSSKFTLTDHLTITNYEKKNWDSNQISTEITKPLNGELKADVYFEKNTLKGTLTNNTSINYYDVIFDMGNGILKKIDVIKSGETLDLNIPLVEVEKPNTSQNPTAQNIKGGTYYRNGSSYIDPYTKVTQLFMGTQDASLNTLREKIKSGEITKDRAREIIQRKDRFAQIFQQKLYGNKYYPSNVKDSSKKSLSTLFKVDVYAFSTEKFFDQNILVNGKEPIYLNENLLLTKAKVNFSKIEEFEIPYGFLDLESLTSSKGATFNVNYSERALYLDQPALIEFCYYIPKEISLDLFQIKWDLNEKEIFNYKENRWEEIKTDEYINVENYIGKDGIIKLHTDAQGLQQGARISLPDIRLKGGVSDATNN